MLDSSSASYTYTANNDLTGLTQTFTGSAVTFTYGYNKDHQRNSLGVDDGDFLYHPSAASSTAYAANAVNQYGTVGAATCLWRRSERARRHHHGERVHQHHGLRSQERARLDGATGGMTDSYAYDPYGESASLTGNAFRFAGMRLDAESGLYYDRARYYAPALGRFLQTDPIGTRGGINLYAYVNNDPIDGTDPAGTCYPLCTTIAGGAVGAVIGGVHAYLEGGDVQAVLAGAATGAVFGAVIGSEIPLAVGTTIRNGVRVDLGSHRR